MAARGRARRSWLLAVALGSLGLAPAPAGVEAPRVTVERVESASEVEGSFDVAVPRAVAWRVLTDYDRIAEFVASVRLSEVESRRDSGVLLRQEVVGGVFPFRRVAHLLLSVRERPDSAIEFHDVLDRDFRVYRGRWELRPGRPGTAVSYRLRAEPIAATPDFVDRAVMSRAAQRLLAQVRAEMLRRAGAGSSGSFGAP